ncbi:hypothetical protein [uncultured Rikenella sp.]|uniref:hypothetical protein n=1 Tax=uncultured Rikenella sp. TaxID=368003 RepID=UPI00272AFF47|nr:hypothetical protein [uncultured Rikenella sp.]
MKLTSQQISVLRTLRYGANITNEHKARIIRQIEQEAPGLIIITSQIGAFKGTPIFGAVLSREGRRLLDEYDAAKK